MKRLAKILRSIANWLDPLPIIKEQAPRDLVTGVGAEAQFPPSLGYLNPTSPTWYFIRDWASALLERVRHTNDSLNCDVTKTAALRGEIKVLKELLALANPKPSMAPRKGLLDIEEELRSY
jgi:hypothetical protein